jgi:long-chain acyl-CoA synthetase
MEDGWYRTGDQGTLDEQGFLTLQGRKKDMLVMPDGTKVHPADIEQALIRDARVRDAAVVGLERPGSEIEVHAVLILHEPSEADDVVHVANRQLGGHQQIRGFTVWPEEEFPRTPTLKVKKPEIVEWILAAKADEAAPSGTDAPAAAGSPVERLVGQLDGVKADAIRSDARLSTDLGIDSLGRVELLGMIEESLGVYIDDGELDPEETLAQLQARVDAAPPGSAAPEGIFGWPLNPVVGALRIGLQTLIILPLVSLFYRRPVRGREHLVGLQGPVMFAANHHLHNDNALILMAIPLGWRWKLSVAAAADTIFASWWRGPLAAILGNAFPLAREGAVRHSLNVLGARLDRGFSVLIYPEGKLTVDGPLQEFKSGTGLVAIHGAIPVVPVRLRALKHSRVDEDTDGTAWRGEVEVVFGKPLRFNIDADPTQATAEIRSAIEAL